MTDKFELFKNQARAIHLSADEKQALFKSLFTIKSPVDTSRKNDQPGIDWGKIASLRKTNLAAIFFTRFSSPE